MELDDIKLIWKSQDAQPQFTIDPDALQVQLGREAHCTRFGSNVMDWVTVLVSLLLAYLMARESIANNAHYEQIAGALFFLFVAIQTINMRVIRKRNNIKFDQSFRGILDSTINVTTTSLKLVKRAIWWFCVPLLFFGILSFIFKFDSKSLSAWVGILLTFLVYLLLNVGVARKTTSRLKKLRSLRQQWSNGYAE